MSYVDGAKRLITDHVLAKLSPKYKLNYRGHGRINFIDVGSIGGLPPPWRTNANVVRFLLNFEPNDQARRSPNTLTYNTAVWDAEETLPFYVYKGFHNTGSSLFRQNFQYVKDNFDTLKLRGPSELAESWFERSALIRTLELKCRPLDSILKEEFPSTPFHFMKVDAQGAEFNVLKGAQSLLAGSCLGLHLELFVLPLYEGIVLLEDVEAYLKPFGFRLAKKFPAHGTFDSQHDCLFLKDTGDASILTLIRQIYGIEPRH